MNRCFRKNLEWIKWKPILLLKLPENASEYLKTNLLDRGWHLKMLLLPSPKLDINFS